MIKMQVLGNLGQDATVNNVNGKNVANFSVAHKESWTTQQGEKKEKTTWVSCSLWYESSRLVQYLKKGTQVFLEGVPEAGVYTNQQGQSVASLKLRVTNVQLLGGKQNSTEQNQPQPQEAADITEPLSDLPF